MGFFALAGTDGRLGSTESAHIAPIRSIHSVTVTFCIIAQRSSSECSERPGKKLERFLYPCFRCHRISLMLHLIKIIKTNPDSRERNWIHPFNGRARKQGMDILTCSNIIPQILAFASHLPHHMPL
jgi:hypothetical protein